MASGTDEHGTPITYEADKQGIPPREFVDRNNALIVEDLRRLGMTYDIFTRTTTRNHYRVTQDMFLKLYEKGYLIKKTQLGAFDPVSGRTLPDRYIEGKCPICGFPEARACSWRAVRTSTARPSPTRRTSKEFRRASSSIATTR